MKIAIEIPDPKCGKFCSYRCQFYAMAIIADHCQLFGSLKRVKKSSGSVCWFSYIHEDCKKAYEKHKEIEKWVHQYE